VTAAPLAEADPIWGAMPATVLPWADDGREVECARAGGRYRMTGSARATLNTLTVSEKAKLTTLIVDSNRAGEPAEINTYTFDQIRDARVLSVAERMDRLMAYFACRNFRPGTPIVWLVGHQVTPETIRSTQEALAWIEAESDNELGAFRDLLDDVGFIRNLGTNVAITPAGFVRMDELRRGGAPTNRAFVAMWFANETSDAYEQGIAPAITETGFEPVRIDKKEHINKIDDEIVAEIKRSRFVVADFTSSTVHAGEEIVYIPRGGVYYEAGLAQGRDIPVIWCVRHDQIDRVHFDTRQFNHIVWESPEDLRTKLRNRIRALFADAS
jgi:hypothetical protein